MVEAAVVIPVMVIFLGTTMFAYRSYNAKMDQQTGTRADVLTYASNNCEGSGNGATLDAEDVSGALGEEAVNGEAGRLSGSLRESESAAASRTKNAARVERTALVSGSAVDNGTTVRMTRRITSMSKCSCNEKRYDNRWSGLLGYAGSLFSNGFGN